MEENKILFRSSTNLDDIPILSLDVVNGDIHVKGKLVENDKLVVDGLRDFIVESNKLDVDRFLNKLLTYAKEYGWKGDYAEIKEFVKWCHKVNGRPEPTEEDLDLH